MSIHNRSGFDMHNLDPRFFLVILPLAAAATLTWTGDRATFIRAPKNAFENICAILPVTGYKLFRDRTSADVFSAVFILVALAAIMIPLCGLIHKIYKWEQLKKMHKDQKMESQILQKLHEKDG
jgi:hypothetical protein